MPRIDDATLCRFVAHPETVSQDGILALCQDLDDARKAIVTLEARGGRSKLVPLNLDLDLDDGRHLVVKSGGGPKLVARQKTKAGMTAEPLKIGETVKTVPGKDGRKAVLRVSGHKGKDLVFTILGSEEPDTVQGPGVGKEADGTPNAGG